MKTVLNDQSIESTAAFRDAWALHEQLYMPNGMPAYANPGRVTYRIARVALSYLRRTGDFGGDIETVAKQLAAKAEMSGRLPNRT
jgi:hypothetical protein